MLGSELSKPNLRRILLNSFEWQCFLLSFPVFSSPEKYYDASNANYLTKKNPQLHQLQ
jgi:hypothetical protein